MSNRRSISRRKILSLTGSAGVAGLAGCMGGDDGSTNTSTNGGGGSGDETSSGTDSNSGGSSGEKATLWAWNDPGLTPIRKEQGKEFKNNFDVGGVDWQYYPFENYLSKATSAIPAGNAPDSLALSVLWVSRFGSKGAAVDLEANGFNADDYVPAARNNASYDGKLWAVPWYADCRLLCINRSMFKEAGLEVPDPTYRPSWDEWETWVTELSKTHGTAYSMPAGEGFDSFVLSNGSGYLSEDGTEARINSDAALEAANFLQPKIVEDDSILARNPGGTSAVEDFLAGEAPMFYAGSWHFPRLRKSGLDWQYNPHPSGPNVDVSHTWSAGVFYSVPSRGGASKELGLKWLEYIDSMEVQKNVTKAMGGFPGRKDAYETDAFQQYLEENPKLKTVAQEMENTKAFPSHPEVSKMWNTVHTQAQSMWQGEDPEKALDKAAQEINALL
ncbi:sugar ABC transporter substrate-binding protein [Halogeometricum borinquense]|uniref:ABC-type sugar transport system, periplasmic component n=3 Tax=Halogeometricum borinquense TaxID=60847 RepID=E4NVI0_HALBP|nr:extracellular solute-binding protein [Halogeometricum borinquense]ADQ68864.1 ABC-type sugar transport system, periplasmic component [Halogeometricum borinquense DSM 11551]